DAEVVPVEVTDRKGAVTVFARDERIRPETSADSLGKLRATQPGGVVTAGSGGQPDLAAAAVLGLGDDRLGGLGLEPIGSLASSRAAGCDPALMGLGPVAAVDKLFARTGHGFADYDLIELNEAFACQVLGVLRGWGWDDRDRL